MDIKKTLLAATLASSFLFGSQATIAHSGSPEYVPIEQALSSSGARSTQ